MRGIVLVGSEATVRRDPASRDAVVGVLQDEGISAAWLRYWAPLFGPNTAPETLAAAHRLALEQNVDDVIRGVRAFHDRPDHAEFVSTWTRHLVAVPRTGLRPRLSLERVCRGHGASR